ncbi:UPF0481 protein [Cocos nucifera]|uniref:UPF0481 protein n=1 Tax=Cocos nucifera TaxID=13894 RepID=A0A8K0HXK5_COCNU|nr:UPF0481 protein [Cocos nucifera]
MPSTGTSSASGKSDEAWMNEVMDRINSSHPVDHRGNPCTIFKVPKHIRQLDCEAYEPMIASLGPFHHQNPNERSVVQHHKWQCAWHFLSRRRSQEHANRLLDQCLLELTKRDDRVRRCYSEELSALNAQDMALIMLLDGCFIIYLILKEKESSEARKGEVVLNIDGKEKLPEYPTVAGLFTFNLVVYDLLKLENQIPFFIIQLSFEQLEIREDDEDLVDLALKLFKGIHPEESESFKKKGKRSPNEYHHLLHLFYSSRTLSEKPAESTSAPGCIRRAIECMKSRWRKAAEAAPSQRSTRETWISAPRWIPSATELDRSGVRFKKKKLPVDNFLNITFEQRKMIKMTPLPCLLNLCSTFSGGRMEIPPLQIFDYTAPLFRNLIAFEQCYYDTEMYITIYALFMDCIIDQVEDVRLLHLEGILEHGLSNDQAVADLFNGLGGNIHFDWEMNYLANQIVEANKFYGSKWHKWLARLRRDYLSNPWAIISVFAAIFLLLLTIEQAVFSSLSYFHS